MAGQGATSKDRFSVHVPLDIGHTDWKSTCPNQGSKRDARQEAAEHTQGAREGEHSDRGYDVGSIGMEHCRLTDTSTTAVV